MALATDTHDRDDSPATATADHLIAIVGAGISGIGMGIALRRSGIDDFVICERAGDIGGTWRDNTYPGIGVDVPAQAYQFSYELKPDWSRIFAKGREVRAYIDQCADNYDIRQHVRLNADVRAREWDEEAQLWRLTLGDGANLTARYVINAIGPFPDPKPAVIPGIDDFAGTTIASQRWQHDVDLTGKRVAIVGTGASAVQIIPEIAPRVGRLDVYQRTPIWVAPKPDPTIPAPIQQFFRRFPSIQNHVRAWFTKGTEDLLVTGVVKYERFGWITRSVGWVGRHVWYRQVRDPRTRAALIPDYDIGCKRPAVSNRYLRTFNRPNVNLIADPIDRVTESGIRTSDGTDRDVDILILATGFHMSTDPAIYRERPIRGRDGFDLADFFATHRARSYESISMPGLPNHFFIFGPYGWTGGTWHVLVETASTHIIRLIAEAERRGAGAVEVSEEAADRWTRFAVERLGRSLWQVGSCATANSYYFDRNGDNPYLRPTSSREAWHAARTFPLDDYDFTPASTRSPHSEVA